MTYFDQPKELFVVCSFVIFRCSKFLYLNLPTDSKITKIGKIDKNVNKILSQLWIVVEAMIEQRRSNVQMISRVVQYSNLIIQHINNKIIDHEIIISRYPISQYYREILISSPIDKKSHFISEVLITLFIGIRHLLLFGLFPVLGAPSPSTSLPTSPRDPALTVIPIPIHILICYLQTLQDILNCEPLRIPVIVDLWLHIEEVGQTDETEDYDAL